MADVASEQMVRRVFAAMASMSTGEAAGRGEATGMAAEVSHGQLLVFLADVLRGTAEERAPIVMVMAGGSEAGVVTCDQVSEVSMAFSLSPMFPLTHVSSKCRLSGHHLLTTVPVLL